MRLKAQWGVGGEGMEGGYFLTISGRGCAVWMVSHFHDWIDDKEVIF